MKKLVAGALLALGLAGFGGQANAAPIGLGLVIDGSGSISGADFTAQKNGYVAALNAVLPTNGSVAVGVYQFSGAAQTEFAFQVINNVADLNALTAAIGAMTQLGGTTNIGNGIDLAASQMAAFGYGNLEKAVIDVSTDGISSGTPLTNAQNFVNAALATVSGEGNVNCLGIGGGANCNFIAGPNSFSVNTSFANIEDALKLKIRTETVPEAASLGLLGLGLVGLGFAARRRVAA